MIRIENLTKYYGKNRGIDQICLTVERGEFFGFIGPNGAGKSTTIRTLLGLIHPTSGQAYIDGIEIQTEREHILKKVGYMPSEAMFYSGMKVKEILKLSADLHGKNCKEEAEKLCERLKLDPSRKVEELSLGNRKKVAIVCALQHHPELLILDEPTSGLDPLIQKEFFDVLHEVNEKGCTIFLSSHVLSEIQRHCTKAAIIREGRIIACDQVEALAKARAKKVTIQGSVSLQGLKGIKAKKEGENTVSFLYSGELEELLQALAEGKIHDLSITDPDLEEIFLHYYLEGGSVQ